MVSVLVRHKADADIAHCRARDDGESGGAKAVGAVPTAILVTNAHIHNRESWLTPAGLQHLPVQTLNKLACIKSCPAKRTGRYKPSKTSSRSEHIY